MEISSEIAKELLNRVNHHNQQKMPDRKDWADLGPLKATATVQLPINNNNNKDTILIEIVPVWAQSSYNVLLKERDLPFTDDQTWPEYLADQYYRNEEEKPADINKADWKLVYTDVNHYKETKTYEVTLHENGQYELGKLIYDNSYTWFASLDEDSYDALIQEIIPGHYNIIHGELYNENVDDEFISRTMSYDRTEVNLNTVTAQDIKYSIKVLGHAEQLKDMAIQYMYSPEYDGSWKEGPEYSYDDYEDMLAEDKLKNDILEYFA
ncbi:MAG: hypothetical protein ACI4UB_05550 [Limosilactobacillus sp.]